MTDQNEKVGCALSGEHGPRGSSLAALRCEPCGNTPVAAWHQARRMIADRDAQIAEAESAAAGALAQIVEMRAEINQISEERTTEVDGLRKQIADANACSSCGGTPPSSGGSCVCGGTNSREREVEGLRGIVFSESWRIRYLTCHLATMRSALLAADVAFKSIKACTDTGLIARAIAVKGITDIFLCLAAIDTPTADPKPEETPVPKVLHCPRCGLQHIDVDDDTGRWATTRLHRKHLCKPSDGGCGQVWRPFDYPTVGVREASSRSSITTTAGDAGGVRSDRSAGLCAPAIRPLTADEARKRADGCESEALRHVRGFAPDVVDGLRSTAASWRRYANLLERGDAFERAAEDALIQFDKAVATMDEGGYMETLRSVLHRAKENR